MSEWKEYRIDELGKLGRGKSKHRPRNDASLFNGEYPFVQTGDIKAANFYLTEYSQTYTEKGLAQSKLWKKGTLCITIAANIGETAILGLDACFPDSIIGFTPYENKSDVRFIKYLFDLLKIHFQSISQGTTQDNLSQEKLLTIKFKAPDFQTQQKIANILGTYDELIEVNNERIKILEETAQSIYKEWFVRFRFPNYQDTEFIKGVPKGWEIGKLGSLMKVNCKNVKLTENEIIYYVDISSVSTGRVDNKTLYNFSEAPGRAKRVVQHEDIIFSTVRPENKAYTMILNPENNLIVSTGFAVLTPNESCFATFIYMIISSNSFVDEMINKSKGSAYPQVSFDDIKNYNILIPNSKLMNYFDEIISPIFTQIETLQQQNTELRQIRDRLLPRLISGKMVV